MSYNYQDVATVKLEYEMPEDKAFTYPPVQELEVTVRGTGWELLSLAFGNKDRVLTVPVAQNDTRVVMTSSWNARISRVLSKITPLNVQPETIRLQTEPLARKTVPIVLDEQTKLAPLHKFVDSIQINPKTVEITGPASVVRTIQAWKTMVLFPSEPIDKDLNIALPLVNHPSSNLEFSVEKVQCTAKVEEITEKRIQVPVEIINAPEDLLIVLLPKTVEIVSSVGLSDYDRLSQENFKVVVDFSTIDVYQQRTIKVQLSYKPSYVTYVQYSPKKLDYIIKSKDS
ncbi:MAG: hypothetical protein ACRBFS_24685 [Aureispira sp.]